MLPIIFKPFGIPIYGYGMMLFFAFIFCNLLARRLCKREGIDANLIPDLAIYLFVSGILGGRAVFVTQYWERFSTWYWNSFNDNAIVRVISLWDGGLVLYGALFGALIGFLAYYHIVLKKHNVSIWKMCDIVAPCIALGIALGRIGCLFTGCCYGNVACESCPGIQFPNPAAGWQKMVERGYQTPLGFLFRDGTREIEAVEPGAEAAEVLKAGDEIIEVNGKPALTQRDVIPTPEGVLKLTVVRDGHNVNLLPFIPHSIRLNPTQPFETISMCLLLFFLLSYHPFKRHDGELLVFLIFGYGMHRFLNEMLRTDTDPVWGTGLTLSQNISLCILAVGVVLAVVVWRRPAIGAMQPVATEIAKPPG